MGFSSYLKNKDLKSANVLQSRVVFNKLINTLIYSSSNNERKIVQPFFISL
jgi:hypothetical protein